MDAKTRHENQLGHYLQTRRMKLDPAALGFPLERRRTPGLRREEVAQRANISPTWYTWLEQGRGGAPSADERKVWEQMRRGQDIAMAAAKVGAPAGSVDDAVRSAYESWGYGPGYKLPGTSHRTGHGIGMEGHEPVNLVHGETTPLAPGMCFSNEPGIYLPGKFGIRLEDCFHMTEAGPKWFTVPPPSIDRPFD